MAKFVLIVFFATYNNYTAVTMQDFSTKETCEAARKQVNNDLRYGHAECLEK